MTRRIVPPSIRVLALAAAVAAATPVGAKEDVLSAADEQAYAAAVAAAETGRWDDAFAAAAQAESPVLRDWLTWLRMLEPASGYSFGVISEFMRAHPDWPWQRALQRRAEEAITVGDDPTQVFAWFQDKEPVSADGWIAKARAMALLDRTEELPKTVRRAWREADFGPAQEKTFVALFGGHLTQADHVARLDRLLWARDTDDARRMLRLVDAGQRALAQARIALIDRANGVDAAVDRVPPELRDDPGLVFDRLRWRRQAGLDTAAELLSHPSADTERADLWWRERAILARDALEDGRPADAYAIISAHKATGGYPLADGEWMAGWIALRFLNDPARALTHFERLHANVTTPISLSRGAYWAGRAREAMGDADAAAIWYREAAAHATTYYGQLAALKLPGESADLPPDPEPTAEDKAFIAGHGLTKVARALAEIGETDRLTPFIHQLQKEAETPGAKLLATELAATLGDRHAAVAAARRAALDGVTLVNTAYPVARFATAEGVEEALVLSIIRQESNFNANAVSRVGARGLMQLMPRTARGEARKLALDFSKARLTSDPAFNVALGSNYLSDLIARFDGSYVMAIAAYNAGPGRSVEWAERFGDPRTGAIDPIDWVEMIPFSETRNYVQRVLEGLQVYRKRLGKADRLAATLEQDLMR